MIVTHFYNSGPRALPKVAAQIQHSQDRKLAFLLPQNQVSRINEQHHPVPQVKKCKLHSLFFHLTYCNLLIPTDFLHNIPISIQLLLHSSTPTPSQVSLYFTCVIVFHFCKICFPQSKHSDLFKDVSQSVFLNLGRFFASKHLETLLTVRTLGGCYWHPASRSQGCCRHLTMYLHVQDNPS